MRFLYKIYSGYDGFQPNQIENRMDGNNLILSWKHYIDVVQKGWNCWVYFMGAGNFENGVYIRGTVEQVDLNANTVQLGVGLTCHAPACCNLAVLSLFGSCLRAFGEVLLTILLALSGFCQRDGRSAAVAGMRRTGWKGCSLPQNAVW